jgi:hypothetical protein
MGPVKGIRFDTVALFKKKFGFAKICSYIYIMVLDKTLIGKKVKVYLPQTYYKGSNTTVEACYIVGVCEFAGINQYLGVKQITVNRRPIFPIRESDVVIL